MEIYVKIERRQWKYGQYTPWKSRALEVANAANQTAISISENSSEEVKKATASVVSAANLAAQSVLTGNCNPVKVVNNVSNSIKKKT